MLPQHDYTSWKLPVVGRFEGLDELLTADTFPTGIYATTLASGHVFDFLVRRRPSTMGLVVFSAAVNRTEFPQPPMFYGQSLAAALNATLISISEIALTYAPDLEIGWHAGAHDIAMQTIMPKVLLHLRQRLGIDRLVFFGGSAGGFASLYYGNIMDDVFPVAANPQTQISCYYTPPVNAYAKHCWNWDETTDIHSFLDGKISQRLAPLYTKAPRPFLYVQNLNDRHVERHALPFMKELCGRSEAISGAVGSGYIDFMEAGEGHIALSKQTITDILKGVFSWNGSWEDYVEHLVDR